MALLRCGIHRFFIYLLTLVCGVCATTRSVSAEKPATSEPTRRMNLVLFVTDDESPTLGCYGDPVAKTPAVDQLAKEGTRFTHAFCTTASCSASRSVILTGLFNHANAQFGHEHTYHHFRTYDRIKSLPVLLTQAGYRTARAGKFHVAPEEVYQFDERIAGSSRSPVEMAENCAALFKRTDKPFFLYFCTSDPHRGGGTSDGPHRPDLFGNKQRGNYPGIKEVKYDAAKLPVPDFLPDNDVTRAELAQYYQSVSRIDQGLARLVALLKQTGAYENTLIIFTADHGMAFPGAKTNVYEPALNVPFVVRDPRADKRGIVNDAMISFIDLTPTLLDAAGAKLPEKVKFHGRSFLGIIDQEHPKGWDEVNASHTFHEITMYYPMRVVRDRRYKLIWNLAHPLPYPFASDLWAAPTWQHVYKQGPEAMYGKRTVANYMKRPKFELYDLKEDPHEADNLADRDDQAERLEEMKARLKKFQKETRDPWIMKWNYE